MNTKQLKSSINSQKVPQLLGSVPFPSVPKTRVGPFQKNRSFFGPKLWFLSKKTSVFLERKGPNQDFPKLKIYCKNRYFCTERTNSNFRNTIPFSKGYALKTGAHVGHKSLRLSKTNFWHPLMAQYFLGIRHGISLLDPVQTRKCLLRAFYVIALVLKTKNIVVGNSRLLSKQKTNPFYGKHSFPKTKVFGKISKFKQKSTEKEIQRVQNKTILQKGHLLLVNTNPEFSRLCKNLSVLTNPFQKHKLVQKNSSLSKIQEFWNGPKKQEFWSKKTKVFLERKEKEKTNSKILEKQFSFVPKINNIESSLSYVHYKWVGGTLTNWKQVSKSVLTYAKFAERCEKFLYRNNIDFPRYKKIKECFHGLISKKQGKVYLAFKDKPDLIFLMNPNENRHVIAEANKMHIPVIALVESNTCLKGISYPIPANAYSAFFIYYCLKKLIKLSRIQ